MGAAGAMAIEGSVGVGGDNDRVDVKLVQAALNLVNPSLFSTAPVVVDGIVGPGTNGAIRLFQETVLGMQRPDSRVDPNGQTIRRLRATVLKGFGFHSFRSVMAHSSTDVVDPYFPLFSSMMDQYGVDTPLRIAHFLAQVGHESLSLRYTEEIATGEAYEGRIDLGNTEKGDGVRFKGRGLIQLTGRANYEAYAQHAGLDLLSRGNENIISETPQYALDVSLWFWQSRNLNRYADEDNLRAITRRVNGGFNGLEDRQRYLSRAKFFLL